MHLVGNRSELCVALLWGTEEDSASQAWCVGVPTERYRAGSAGSPLCLRASSQRCDERVS